MGYCSSARLRSLKAGYPELVPLTDGRLSATIDPSMTVEVLLPSFDHAAVLGGREPS